MRFQYNKSIPLEKLTAPMLAYAMCKLVTEKNILRLQFPHDSEDNINFLVPGDTVIASGIPLDKSRKYSIEGIAKPGDGMFFVFPSYYAASRLLDFINGHVSREVYLPVPVLGSGMYINGTFLDYYIEGCPALAFSEITLAIPGGE